MEITLKWEIIRIRKRIGHRFFHKESMKFQNISKMVLNVCYAQESVTNEKTDKLEAICPPLFQSWGQKNQAPEGTEGLPYWKIVTIEY